MNGHDVLSIGALLLAIYFAFARSHEKQLWSDNARLGHKVLSERHEALAEVYTAASVICALIFILVNS